MSKAKTPDGTATGEGAPAVPSPVPPDSGDAWYAPDVRAQYELLASGVHRRFRNSLSSI